MKARVIGVTTTARSARLQRGSRRASFSQLLERPSRALVSLPRKQLSLPARANTARAATPLRSTASG
jgi:hypothetical protein